MELLSLRWKECGCSEKGRENTQHRREIYNVKRQESVSLCVCVCERERVSNRQYVKCIFSIVLSSFATAQLSKACHFSGWLAMECMSVLCVSVLCACL